MKKQWLIWMALLIVLVLTACSNNDEAAETKEKESTSNAEGGTLIYGRGTDSVSLDPIRETDGESFKVARNVYETLVKFGEKDTSIEPSLAKEWNISDDGLTYTFKLNEKVTFHDGAAFNAEAVVKNFERWMNGSVDEFPYYGDMWGGYKGDDTHIIKSVKATDDQTFVLELSSPSAAVLNNLAMVAFSIASPDAFNELEENPVGTGPFAFKQWKRNDAVYLEKNTDYWQEGLPKSKELIFKTIPDNSARINGLIAGEIDIADGLSPSDSKRIDSESSLKLLERPSFNIGYLGMTLTQKPFDDEKVREAISYAVDRQAIIDSFFEGKAELAKNPVQPTALGYDEDVKPYEYDVKKAKSLLEESSYNGDTIELWAMPIPRPYMPDGQKVAEAIQKNLEDIGMKTKIVTYEWPTYLEKTGNGDAQLFLLGGTSDNGDPDNLLSLFFDKGASLNKTQLDDADIQKWLKEGRQAVEDEERIAAYTKVQEKLRDIIPALPLVHATPVVAELKEVEGYQPHPTESDDLSTVFVKE